MDYNNNVSNEYTISNEPTGMPVINGGNGTTHEIRNACDGVEALDGKIYFVGGRNFDTLQSHTNRTFDPVTNT